MEKINGDLASKEHRSCCLARTVLWYLVFFGFAVNYMIRTNLNISIVSMVKARPKTNQSLSSECIIINTKLLNTSLSDANTSFISGNASITSLKLLKKSATFDWNEKQQSHILGSFFWLHWLTQIPGGILASKYGTKLVFGLSNFAGVLCCFFIPICAYFGPVYIITLRVFQGFCAGFSWPAMHNMTARWIPPNERSKFVTAYLGSSIGAALTYPICGFIAQRWGWELSFYTCGVVGAIWYLAWCFLVYDSPAKHPRISLDERDFIVKSLGGTYSKKKAPVPWKSIFTSVPVWMNVVAQFGGIWGFFTLMTYGPIYFRFIHGWSVQTTGLLSGIGHVFRTSWSYLFSVLGDCLLRNEKLSRTNVRKLATVGCNLGQGLFMLALAYSGCNYTFAVVFLSAAVAMNGSVSTGPLASIVDLSPNYASVILGFVNSIAAIVGFVTPVVVGLLTYQNQTVGQWQKVFLISGIILVVTGLGYVIFAKAELQEWNSAGGGGEERELGEELVAVKREKGVKGEYQRVDVDDVKQ